MELEMRDRLSSPRGKATHAHCDLHTRVASAHNKSSATGPDHRRHRMTMNHRSPLTLLTLSTLCFAGCVGDDTDDDLASDSAQTGTETLPSMPLAPDYVLTPSGGIHKSCFHELADTDTMADDVSITHADGTSTPIAPCLYARQALHTQGPVETTGVAEPEPVNNGWIESANWTSSVAIKSMHADFMVPKAPTSYRGQTVFLFPALEPTSGSDIIQPVLQYGPSAAGGGEYWAIATWFGGGTWQGNYFYSKLRKVSVGETLTSEMEDTGDCHPMGCVWKIAMHDSHDTTNLNITVLNGVQWQWVFGGVLEAYNVTHCNQYPDSHELFDSISVKDYAGHSHSPSWRHDIGPKGCGEKMTSNSTTARLYY
jgi:hypothetical protein